MTKGKIIKTNGVDWQSDWPTARDQFIATRAHLETTRQAAAKELHTLRVTMLSEAQRQAKSTLHTCTTWLAIYSCVGKIVDAVHDKETGDRLKLGVFGYVKACMGLDACKNVPADRIGEMKGLVVVYLEEYL